MKKKKTPDAAKPKPSNSVSGTVAQWDDLAEAIARTAARKLFKETYGNDNNSAIRNKRRPPKDPVHALAYHIAYEAAQRDFILAHPHLQDLFPPKEVEDAVRVGPSKLAQAFVGVAEACEHGASEFPKIPKKNGPSR